MCHATFGMIGGMMVMMIIGGVMMMMSAVMIGMIGGMMGRRGRPYDECQQAHPRAGRRRARAAIGIATQART